jgi:hypothetical protein
MLAEIVWTTGTIAIVGAFLVPIIAIVASAAVKSSRTRALADLKTRLIEKGMSADEIKKVVEAGEGSGN